ncbi:unnamed protein product [Diamesa serratosioi]
MQRPSALQQQERHHGYNNQRAGIFDGKIAGLYDLEETLGSGHFAVVKSARHVFTGEKVAVKVIDKTKLDEVSKAHLFQEVRCMKLVQHPHVVRLYEVIDTQTKLYLILELGDGGDLYDYIMRHETGLSETLAREYFRQIVRAISYCHQLHVVHRDLKPENVVFFEKLGVVKLTDFGFSNKFCPGQKLETSCGSLAYSAPEILLGDSYDAPAVDVWSLGVILYMLVCGQPPFQEANDSETLTMIMDCKYTMPAHVSMGCKNLINSMLVREPEKRANLQQIAADSWLIQGSQPQPQNQPEYLPLVSREQVSEDDHSMIIQKMVNGNIATKEEILEALDKNEYNHITATYFLLAERKLRAHRQEQQQLINSKKKPDMTLPLTSTTVVRFVLLDLYLSGFFLFSNLDLILQKGRTRKCSIVQEGDEDDEDEAECDESSLNRRGSRSEGRINLAVQDRLSLEVAERLKKEQVVIKKKEDEVTLNKVTVKVIDGIGGIKIIKNNTDSSKEKFLGMAGGGNRGKEVRSSSVDKIVKTSRKEGDIIHTKFLTESSTIHIPVSGTIISGNQIIPKYKTMPSPTRPNALLSGANNSLKEIFEEGDAGSCGSDNSNTNTPKPIIRNSHLNQSPGVAGTGVAGASDRSHHRRTKFQKSRTTSCSSSDASDDDNAENRKKRANKIIDSASAKQFTQRRDSHDDSSDSQDPGTACSGNGTAAATASSLILRCSNGSTTTTNSTNNNQNRTETRGKSSSNSQDLSYRRHRAGRRRPVETRLRESQSLNRITEVQECELQAANNQQNQAEKVDKSKDEEGAGREEAIASKVEHLNNKNTDNNNILKATVEVPALVVDSKVCKNHTNTKTKSFSARILQNLNFKKTSNDGTTPSGKLSKSNRNPSNTLDVPLLKLNNSKNQQPLVNEGSTKKIKILGRYFQVHKKICQPLSGLFQRGGGARDARGLNATSNLYKAQSCSSIVKDSIHHTNTIHSATLSTSSTSMQKQQNAGTRLYSEREFLIRNCLSSRFIGSDGDINMNEMGADKARDKQQQEEHSSYLLHYIDDDILVEKSVLKVVGGGGGNDDTLCSKC